MREWGNAAHRTRRRTLRTAAALALAVALSPLASGPVTSASAAGQYAVGATADGVRISVLGQNFLIVDELVDAGIPAAQSVVDSLGNSSAFAGNPYPGTTVVSAPALASGNTGQEVPDYPLYASSQHPTTPEAKVEQQGYALRAKSSESSSESTADAGVAQEDGSGGRTAAASASTVDPDTGAATAAARSDAIDFTFNETLTLGRVRSVATVTIGPDGKVSRSSDLSVADTTVGGQRVAITPDGVVAGDQPSGLAAPGPDPIAAALEQAGIAVRYLAPAQTEHGVVAAGIEVSARQQDPTSGAVLTVTYTFGRASASARSSVDPLPDLDLPPIESGPAVEAGTSSEPVTTDAAPVLGDVPPPTDSAPAPVADPGPGPQPTETRLVAMPTDIGASGIYLMTVLAGMAILACGTLLRLLGVRSP